MRSLSNLPWNFVVLKNFKCGYSTEKMSKLLKPPNVLVYSGEVTFEAVERKLSKCLDVDKYIIYPLHSAQVLNNLWKENAALLLICDEISDHKIANVFKHYVENGGKLLSFCSNLNLLFEDILLESTSCKVGPISVSYKDVDNISVYRGKYSYKCDKSEILCFDSNNKPVIQKVLINNGICIFSEVHFFLEPSEVEPERTNSDENTENYLHILKDILSKHFSLLSPILTGSIPDLTPGYIIAEDDSNLKIFLSNIKITEIPVLNVALKDKSSHVQSIKANSLPLIPFDSHSTVSLSFDKSIYFSKLKTNTFGRHVIYFPVVHTTMQVAEFFAEHDGLVIVAGQQLMGRGRGKNKWISSEGCAIFTLRFSVPLSSYLGKHLPILQHVASLAVVHSVKSLKGYEELNLKIKWPNDIYYGKDCKLGGNIITTTVQNGVAQVMLGIGINVSNSQPTSCINDVIKSYNAACNDSIPEICVEELIAGTLNHLEYFASEINKSGLQLFFSLYYSYWMHCNQRVLVSAQNKEAIVEGIDEYGFLIVKTDCGQTLVLQPDGNSFDIMKNLIVMN